MGRDAFWFLPPRNCERHAEPRWRRRPTSIVASSQSIFAARAWNSAPVSPQFKTGAKVAVRHVDRWTPAENHDLFPELADEVFPTPDVVANFDTDRLRPIATESQDFVICSHVLEHLAEPIGFIAEIHRVLRLGGVALVLLPDRRRTFDCHQDPTPLEHLVAEHRDGVTAVDDAHIRTFVERADGDSELEEPAEGQSRAAFYEMHRMRSVHVHYWSEDEFPVLLYGMKHLGQRWTLIHRMHCRGDSVEFGFLLQRSGSRSRLRTVRRFEAAWNTL